MKYIVGSTTAEVIFESRENAEVVTNTDTSGEWWDSDPMGQKQIGGDFAVRYSWKNSKDANWYQDVVLELTNGSLFFSKNFLISAPISSDNMLWTGTPITTVTCSDGSTSIPTQPTTETVLGDYTASIVRIGDTLIVTQVAELDSGITWKVVDRYEGFTENDLTVQINGNPYFADDLRVTVGEMNKTGTAAMDKELGNPYNSTGYTGNTPLWTSTIQHGQKITVTGTATSSGAGQWNSPFAYLWTGETASLNFRADNYLNGVDNQSDTEANVTGFNFHIAKTWQGFDPASANNGDAWTASLIDHYKQGAFTCTVSWDYSEANKIVVQYSFAWEDATFNQQYTITPLSGNLLDTYSIGLGVDCAYYHVTGMTVE